MTQPSISVVVPSHERPVRLRWLLNALVTQTLPPDRFEVLVAYDSESRAVEQLLRSHPLSAAGRLRGLPVSADKVFAGPKRNVAWRAARAPLILFTDDDCRPPAEWVSEAVVAAEAHPGSIVQGTTLPDPDEAAVLRGAPWAETHWIEPPTPWAETCNIAYPRELLERLGGFDERMRVGEDSELAERARRAGATIVAAPSMLVYHAVNANWLPGAVKAHWRWRDVAWLAKRHPALRRHMWGWIFWKREHAALVAAIAGVGLARRRPLAATLAVPWLAGSLRRRGSGGRGVVRSLFELPGRAAIDATEVATLACGSVRYGTLLL
jgi:GT2 family glycosyltransferase